MENSSCTKDVVHDVMSTMQSKMMTIRSELETIRRAVTCSICLCTMKEPITLAGCAHSFCYDCIRQSMEGGGKQSKCPLCQLPTTRRSIQKPSNVGANSVRTLISSYKQMMRSFGCAPIQYTPSIHTLTQLEPMDEENEDEDTGDPDDRPIPSTSQDICDQWHVSRIMLQALKDQQQQEVNGGTTVVTEQILHEQEQIVQVNEQCYRSRHRERDSPEASPIVTSFRPQRQSLESVHRTPRTQTKPNSPLDSILPSKSPHTLTQILQQAQSQEAANQRTPSPTPEEDNFYSAIDLPPPSVSPMKKQPRQRTSLVPVDEESASTASSEQCCVLSATRRKSVSEILQQEEEEEDDHSTTSSSSELPPPAFQNDRSRSKRPVVPEITTGEENALPNDPPLVVDCSKSNNEDGTSNVDTDANPENEQGECNDEQMVAESEESSSTGKDLKEYAIGLTNAIDATMKYTDATDAMVDLTNADATSTDAEVLQISDVVQVQARTWPGINQLGGIAKILKIHSTPEGPLYDVRYVLDRRKECNVQERYVSLHTEIHRATKEDVSQGPRRRSADASQKENDLTEAAIPLSLRKQLIADGCDLDGTIDTVQALAQFKQSKNGTKRSREPERRPSPSRKRPNATAPKQTIEENWIKVEESYRQRIQSALAKGVLYICTSTLSEHDQRLLKQLCHILQKGASVKVQLKLLEKVQPSKTTLCIVPSMTTENEISNVTAERRSLKTMSCSLYAIPMVSPAWIQDSLQEKKIILPKSSMYIRSLPTKTNIPSARFGVTLLAASIDLINSQESKHLKSGGKLLQSFVTTFLVGFSTAEETNFSSLLRQAGVSEVVINKHAALSKLKAFCKKDAATQRQNTTTHRSPPNRFLIICNDSQDLLLPEAFVTLVREHIAVPSKSLQARITCVNIHWLFDSISSGTRLEANTAAPDMHPPRFYYRPLDPLATGIWEITK